MDKKKILERSYPVTVLRLPIAGWHRVTPVRSVRGTDGSCLVDQQTGPGGAGGRLSRQTDKGSYT